MTAFDRVERHLPELFDEIAGAGIPDYFDDMLQSTTQARQRPAWSSLERWLPMGVIARPLPIRPIPWRLIAVAALLVVLAAATLVYVGSRRVAPPPFGLARNGALLIGTADGDIVTVDPATGRAVPVVSGSTVRRWAVLLPRRTALRLRPGDVRDRYGDRALPRQCGRLGCP